MADYKNLALTQCSNDEDAAASAATYTCPASKTAKIRKLKFHNTAAAELNVQAFIVDSGDTADKLNRFLNVDLPANDTLIAEEYPDSLTAGQAIHCYAELDSNDAWAASTVYSKGDVVIPSTPNGLIYVCTVAGTSNSSEPSWGTTIGGTTTDNTVTWTCVESEVNVAVEGMEDDA